MPKFALSVTIEARQRAAPEPTQARVQRRDAKGSVPEIAQPRAISVAFSGTVVFVCQGDSYAAIVLPGGVTTAS